MNNNSSIVSQKLSYVKIVTGTVFLFAGCIIYVLFRSQFIRLYVWCEALGLGCVIEKIRNGIGWLGMSDFLLYSLPDGLYCASYVLIMDGLWHGDSSLRRIVVVSAIPFVAIVHELLQGLHIVRGTFDVCDLLCYSVPLCIYLIVCGKDVLSTK